MNVATILIEFLSAHRYVVAAAVVLGIFVALRYLRASRRRRVKGPYPEVSARPPARTGLSGSPRGPDSQAAPPPADTGASDLPRLAQAAPPHADTIIFGSPRPEAQEAPSPADTDVFGTPWRPKVQAPPPASPPPPVSSAAGAVFKHVLPAAPPPSSQVGGSSKDLLARARAKRPGVDGREYDATIVNVFYATDRSRDSGPGEAIKY